MSIEEYSKLEEVNSREKALDEAGRAFQNSERLSHEEVFGDIRGEGTHD